MLNSIELLGSKSGEITIGFDKSDKELNGKAEGNILGTYGKDKPDRNKARDFLGIESGALKKILSNYKEDAKDRTDKVLRSEGV